MDSNTTEHAQLSRRAVITCIIVTLGVSILELSIGHAFDLLSIFTEGLHTAADLADSVVAFILISIALRPPDRKHPYGHGKFDSLAGIFEGFVVVGSGIWAIYSAIRVIVGITPQTPNPAPATFIAMAAASIIYWIVSAKILETAKKTGSPTVRAEGIHLRSHVYVTASLIVGLGLTKLAQSQNWAIKDYTDPAAAIVLGIVLIFLGYSLVRSGALQLTDTALPQGDLDKITEDLDAFSKEFVEVHAVRSRQAGTEKHVDIHLVVEPNTTVESAHDLAHRIEAKLGADVPGLHMLVHIEPAGGEMERQYNSRGRHGVILSDAGMTPQDDAEHHKP